MRNRITLLLLVLVCTTTLLAKETNTNSKPNYIPLLKYDYLSLDSQEINSPGAGLVIQKKDLMFVALYTRHAMQKSNLSYYPKTFHSIDILYDLTKKRSQYLAIFKSESDQPVYGGLQTFQAAAAYGYEVVKNENTSIVLGGCVAVSDFGIEFSGGKTWPLIPVPLIRMNYRSRLLQTKFEFLTSPNLDLTIAPESKLRFVSECRLDQFRDERDLVFECSLAYRFFSADHPNGDFAGISVGIKNDNYGAFDLGENDTAYPEEEESLETHYNAIFGTIDLTILKISAGKAFKGRELYRGEDTNDIGDGYFISVEALYQF